MNQKPILIVHIPHRWGKDTEKFLENLKGFDKIEHEYHVLKIVSSDFQEISYQILK